MNTLHSLISGQRALKAMIIACAGVIAATPLVYAQCELVRRADLGLSNAGSQITAVAVFDDGMGSTVFAARYQASQAGIVRRDQSGVWQACDFAPGARQTSVRVLMVDEDPALGRVLLATAGNQVLRWSPSSQRWEVHAPAAPVTSISAMVRHADGSGSRLVIASREGGPGKVFERTATGWSALGLTQLVSAQALASFDDDGPGPRAAMLYAVGSRGTSTDAMRWNGTTWEALPELSGWTKSLAVFDDGTGPALYASGHRTFSGPLRYTSVAKWDGQNWTGVDTRQQNPLANDDLAYSMGVFDDGSGHGNELYVQTLTSLVRLRGGMFARVSTASMNPGDTGFQQTLIGGGTIRNVPVLWTTELGASNPFVGCPRCPGDFDLSGDASVQDVWSFTSAWFALRPEADFNRSGGPPTIQDLFDFLSAWFTGCS